MRRDLLTTLTGIGAGQFVLLAATPLLARTYGPQAFGTYSVDVAIAGVIATVAALRLDLAVTSAHDHDVVALARTALTLPWITVPLACVLLVLVLQVSGGQGWAFGTADLPTIALIALPQGLCLAATGLGTRLGRFTMMAIMKVVQPTVFAALALTLLRDLRLAMAVGWAVALLAAFPAIRAVGGKEKWSSVSASVRAAWRFPVISTPVALLDVLALALPLLFISATFGKTSAGNYAQVQRLVGAPLSMVAVAVSQVFFKYAGDRFRAGRPLLPLVRGVALAMGGLACMVAVVVTAIGHLVLQLLVGGAWRTDTGFLLLALCPVLCRVIASPVSTTLIVTGRLAILGRWQASYFVVTLFVLFVARRWLAFDGMLAIFACSELVMYGIYLTLSVRAAINAVQPCSFDRPDAV